MIWSCVMVSFVNYFTLCHNGIMIEIKGTINIMCSNHPGTIPSPNRKKSSSPKPVPGAEMVGDHCSREFLRSGRSGKTPLIRLFRGHLLRSSRKPVTLSVEAERWPRNTQLQSASYSVFGQRDPHGSPVTAQGSEVWAWVAGLWEHRGKKDSPCLVSEVRGMETTHNTHTGLVCLASNSAFLCHFPGM